MKFQAWIDDSPLCRYTTDIEREPFSNGYPVYQGAFICPVCLRVWARISRLFNLPEDPLTFHQGRYEIRSVLCEEVYCSTFWDPILHPFPGSILDNPTMNGVDWGLIDHLPDILLRREFDLHMAAVPLYGSAADSQLSPRHIHELLDLDGIEEPEGLRADQHPGLVGGPGEEDSQGSMGSPGEL